MQKYWRKNYFKSTWESTLPNDLKFKLTKDLFKGKSAFIFAGGTSLNNIDLYSMQNELNKSLVICIKQSTKLLQDNVDVQVMNFCNYSDYDWSNISHPVFWVSFDKNHRNLIKKENIKCDFIADVHSNGENNIAGFSKSMAGNLNWEGMFEIKNNKTMWGPGLMYEMSIPIALHAGVEKIYLVAWDIGSIKKERGRKFLNEHFYDNKILKFKTNITTDEIEIVAQSTLSLNDWMNKRGVKLVVVSDRSMVDESIARELKWMLKN